MARQTHLHAVGDDAKEVPAAPAPEPPKSLVEAVDRSERELLVAMRQKVASELDGGVPGHAFAALMKQLRELDRDIRAMDREEQERRSSTGVAADAPVPDEAFDASAI